MNVKKRIVNLIVAVWLICLLPATAYAHEVPDETRRGSISVEMKYGGEAVTGGTLTIYQVGQIQDDDGDFQFVKTAAMEQYTGNYDDISHAGLSEELAVFVKEHHIPACATVKNADGKAVFTDLELGLYLIVQTEASEGYEPLNPFLVSLPMNEGGQYVYEVNAEGKFQLRQEPEPTEPSKPTEPTEPAKPSEPTLPQTGQLNWPIPVLAVSGLLLFSLGWKLRFEKERDS